MIYIQLVQVGLKQMVVQIKLCPTTLLQIINQTLVKQFYHFKLAKLYQWFLSLRFVTSMSLSWSHISSLSL